MVQSSDQRFKVGDWLVEPNLNRISRGSAQHVLRPQVMDLLVYLARRGGEVVTNDELLDNVWPHVIVSSGSIYNCITELRKAFEDNPHNPRYVETISKRGYRLKAPTDPPPGGGGASATPQTGEGSAASGPAVSTTAPLRLAVLLLFVVVAGWLVLFNRPAREASDSTLPGVELQQIRSLAVLPLQDFSADEQAFWSDGITAALITELSRIQSLRVISHTSVMPYKTRNESVPDIAGKLGVDAVLDGSITRDNGRVALNVSLVRAASERTLWTQHYESDLEDVLSLHRTVANAVASEVDAVVALAGSASLEKAPVVDPQAYAAMLRGEHLQSAGDYEGALQHLRRAVEIDRNFALGWATLGQWYLARAIDDPTWAEAAREAAQRALELDPELPAARTVKAGVALYRDWNWSEAVAELRRTLESNPGYDEAHQILGDYFEFAGDWDQAVAEGIRATQVNPSSASMLLNLGITNIFARRYRDAEVACRRALEIRPQSSFGHRCIAEALAGQGQLNAGLEYLQRAVELDPDNQPLMAQQAIFHAASGTPEHAQRILQQLDELRAQGSYVSPLIQGMVHMALGDRDQALDWIETAIDERAPWTPGIVAWPYFDPLRGEPRFEALKARIGLSKPAEP